MSLTDKEEKFCLLIIEGKTQSDAYRGAYSTSKMKRETIWSNACVLRGTSKVATRIEELQAEHRARHNVTVDSLTEELEEARDMAKAEKQSATMVSASMGKAKIHGLITDKAIADLNVTVQLVSFKDN